LIREKKCAEKVGSLFFLLFYYLFKQSYLGWGRFRSGLEVFKLKKNIENSDEPNFNFNIVGFIFKDMNSRFSTIFP
jgi:hypothetical protein